jgi:glycosyltransferase involved in cell wall biosynthesis
MTEGNAANRRSAADSRISVVLPVYNEARVLPVLVEQVSAALAGCCADWEIVFVNDGSTDDSPEVLDLLAAVDSRVRVIHLSRNFGHQAAVQAGLAHARGDAVVLMDSDLQDTPQAIPRFVDEWQAGCDVVYALRTQRKEGPIKRLLFAAFHRLMSRVATVPIPADAGIFGLVDRRVARQIAAMAESDRYFPGLRSWVGFRQKGVVVERSARYDDHPRVSMRGLFRLAKTALFSFSSFPLAVFYVIGALAAAVFVGLGGYALVCRLFTDLAIPGWTSGLLTGSFFGAINALGISILGEYVVRTYDQVRARPLYLVDRTVNLDRPASRRGPEDADAPFLDLLEQASDLLNAVKVRKAPAAANRVEDPEAWSAPIPFPGACKPNTD